MYQSLAHAALQKQLSAKRPLKAAMMQACAVIAGIEQSLYGVSSHSNYLHLQLLTLQLRALLVQLLLTTTESCATGTTSG
jgi:hypothetical protein